MFSEINGQPLMQHGPYGAALLDFAPNPTSSTNTPITPNFNSISQTERLLIQENLLLRQSCQQLMVQVDQLNRNRDYLNTQFTTFHLLYVQQKQDRARLARQLTSTQRELEHLKRAQVLANSVALGHHPVESSTLPLTRRRPHHHTNHNHHHQFNGNHNHNLFYRSLKVNGSAKTSVNGRGHHRSWRRTQSAKYHGGSSTSTIDQDAVGKGPRSKLNNSKATANSKLSKSTYRRYDELNEEDHKTPGQSPVNLTGSPPVFPNGQNSVWMNNINGNQPITSEQITFAAPESPSNFVFANAVQLQGKNVFQHDAIVQTAAVHQDLLYIDPNCTIDPQFEIENNEQHQLPQTLLRSSDEENGSESDGQKHYKKSSKLVYRDSLRQCVEFSRSLLDLSRRHIVGAEKGESEDGNGDYHSNDENNTKNDVQTETNQHVNQLNDTAVNSEHNQKTEFTNDCSTLLTDFLLTYQALEEKMVNQAINESILPNTDNLQNIVNNSQTIVPIEDAIPMIDASEPQCQVLPMIECAPIIFKSTQTPSSLSSPADTTNANNNNLVVNLSYVSDDLPATYLREVRLPNKPARQFLGIFFESAFSSGVVVQQVVPGSVAAKAGIGPGDRILEICGINMRTANFRLASKVLAQCETDTVCFKIVSSEAAHKFPMLGVNPHVNHSPHIQGDYQNGGSFSEHPEMSGVCRINGIPPGTSDHHQFLLLCSQASTSSSSTAISGSTCRGEVEDRVTSSRLKKTCTLTRREAFKNKQRLHSYFERRHGKEAMLYQMAALTVELPRRITITSPLAKIKLLGGNAVGIFVHSIGDELLGRLLRTGDQLLEYNNFDLTKATAEDAARELAKPVASRSSGVLVAMFNLETYKQIQELPTGDSFYVRAQFSRTSRKNSLEFKKGDILYVDNTLYDGKPGQWRAWRVDEFGRKRSCGLIPSKYTAQCELMKQHWQQQQQGSSSQFESYQRNHANNGSKWYHFKFFSFSSFRGILFWKGKSGCSGDGYTKLDDSSGHQYQLNKSRRKDHKDRDSEDKGRILASAIVPMYSPLQIANRDNESMASTASENLVFPSMPADNQNDDPAETEMDDSAIVPSSYKLVDMLSLQSTPRPVLIYGPFSHLIAARLESAFPSLFRVCSRKNVPISLALSTSPDNNVWEQAGVDGFTHCTAPQTFSESSSVSNLDTLRCIALGDLADAAAEGRHAVISVVTNTVEDFRAHSLFPIVVGLRFHSAKHIKETVNRWKLGEQLPLVQGPGGRAVGYKLAKTSYAHQLKLEHQFSGVTDVRVAGNNIAYMCTKIKDRVSEEQNKVVWRDAEA